MRRGCEQREEEDIRAKKKKKIFERREQEKEIASKRRQDLVWLESHEKTIKTQKPRQTQKKSNKRNQQSYRSGESIARRRSDRVLENGARSAVAYERRALVEQIVVRVVAQRIREDRVGRVGKRLLER